MKSKKFFKQLISRWDELADYTKYSPKEVSKERAMMWDTMAPLINAYPQLWYTGKREIKDAKIQKNDRSRSIRLFVK